MLISQFLCVAFVHVYVCVFKFLVTCENFFSLLFIFQMHFLFFLIGNPFFFLLDIFLYLHFKCYSLSWFPFHKPLIPSPSPIRVAPHLLPLWTPNIPLHWGSNLGRTKGFSFHWCPNKATYAVGALGQPMYSLSVVVQSLETLVIWHYCSYGVARPFSSFSPSTNSPKGGPIFSSTVCC